MRRLRHPLLTLCVTGILALGAGGCGDEHGEEAHGDHAHNNGEVEYSELAMEACGHVADATTAITAAETLAGASGVVLEPGGPYAIALPESGTGYVTFHTTSMHTDWLAFTTSAAPIPTVYDEGAIFDTPSSVANVHCGDELSGQTKLHLHEVKGYVLELRGEGEVWLLILQGGGGHGNNGGGTNNGHGGHGTNNGGHGTNNGHGDHGTNNATHGADNGHTGHHTNNGT